jgi:hypothetical protein
MPNGSDHAVVVDAAKSTPRTISLRRAGDAVGSASVRRKLDQMDANGDGVIDEAELAHMIQELVQEQKMSKLFKWLVVGAAVLFVLLVAALTGVTYGMVSLLQTTKIADGRFIAVKGGTGDSQVALTGGATINLANTTKNAADADILVAAVNRRRRLLGDTTPLPAGNSSEPIPGVNPDLYYMSSLPLSVIAEACTYHSKGLDSFTTHGIDSKAGTTAITNIKLLQISGCDSMHRDLSAIRGEAMMDGVRLEVHCTSTACAVFYDQASLRKPGQVMQPSLEHFAEIAGKAGLDVSGLEELSAKYTNATYTNATNDGRRLAAATRQGVMVCQMQYDRRGNLIRQRNCYVPPCTYANCGKCDWDGTDRLAPAVITMVSNGIQMAVAPGAPGAGRVVAAVFNLFPSACCWTCQPGWMVDGRCGCKEGCFPADAAVEVRGRGTVRMADLAYGDKVLAVDLATGRRVFREVYLFGHRDQDAIATYVAIQTQSGRTLRLTPQHYIPVCVSGCTLSALASGQLVTEARYASQVKAGDVVLVADQASGAVQPSAVVSTWVTADSGLFNPFVRGANLVVDGVVASPHSDWLLDSVTPAGLRKHLPALYELMLAPVYALYRAVGARNAEWLAHSVGLAEAGSAASYGAGYLAVAASTATAVAMPLACAAALLLGSNKAVSVARG